MKRGLKVPMRRCPVFVPDLDARITPMKRGLKDESLAQLEAGHFRCKDYPDEKGTERVAYIGDFGHGYLMMQGLPR